ncbi:MAG: response regulator [Gammaproteobacteria bacterium]|nr:response regulator [Gammaproteobacteria bacterium]
MSIICVIDGDIFARKSFIDALTRFGVEFRVFDSAGGFLTQIDSVKPECVVSEFDLPDMSGLDLLATLQKQGRDYPVAFIPNNNDMQSAVAAIRAGADNYTEKPSYNSFLRPCIFSILSTKSKTQSADT